jgi:hypothetical protein
VSSLVLAVDAISKSCWKWNGATFINEANIDIGSRLGSFDNIHGRGGRHEDGNASLYDTVGASDESTYGRPAAVGTE